MGTEDGPSIKCLAICVNMYLTMIVQDSMYLIRQIWISLLNKLLDKDINSKKIVHSIREV
jgi:hypothetical protein